MSQKPGEGDMDEHTRILPPLQVEAQSACCVALDIQVNPEESLVIKARARRIGFHTVFMCGLDVRTEWDDRVHSHVWTGVDCLNPHVAAPSPLPTYPSFASL